MNDPHDAIKLAEAANNYIVALLDKIDNLEKRLKDCEKDVRFLNYLRAFGVDNWEGYGEAQKMMWKENEE